MSENLISRKNIYKNVLIYGAFMTIALFGIFYGNSIESNFSFLRIWDIQNILFLILGIPFLFIQNQARIPNFYEKTIQNKERFISPLLIGSLFGILDVFVLKIVLHPEAYTELPPYLQPFPYSIFLFFSGAFEIEVFYRLIPLTLFLLIGNKYSEGKYFNYFFWLAIILTSLREPLEQLPSASILVVIYSFLTGFLMNFIQALFFKKAGFLASLTLRLGHYLFWHILLGIYVQFVEL